MGIFFVRKNHLWEIAVAAVRKSDLEPVYMQISEYIREKIYSQEWTVGDQVPTEHKLMESFGVSRGTAQKAIMTLVEHGLLERKQGKGTFVAKPVIKRPVDKSMLPFSEAVKGEHSELSTIVYHAEMVPASRTCQERLQIGDEGGGIFSSTHSQPKRHPNHASRKPNKPRSLSAYRSI